MSPLQTEPPLLFTPIKLRSIESRNRIVASPMCQYVSADGGPNDWQLVNFGRFAVGGAGIVFGEETAVEPRGRKTYHCAGLYQDAHIAAYRRITDFIKSAGAVPAVQLGHCGRRAATHGAMEGFAPLTEEDAHKGNAPWQGISASALPASPRSHVPHAMDRDDIRQNVAAWREAAMRSADAGFDICEIHAAHGYLIHQFLSPVSNKRSDEYGGSLANRMRFALEIVDAVRGAWPADRPLFYRTSVVDGVGGEWGIEDTLALARELKAHGVDVIDCSSGGIMGKSALAAVPRVPGYQVGYAREIKRTIGVPTMAVGLITEPSHAESILRDGHADLIALARELMDHPNWPLDAARILGHSDPLSLLAPRETFRLKAREAQRRDLAPGAALKIPFGLNEEVPYSWTQRYANRSDGG
jgi:2,4-dienoyl-CoA reductase-like NADH-dependent reductase (Old Yellow Enzyme family)